MQRNQQEEAVPTRDYLARRKKARKKAEVEHKRPCVWRDGILCFAQSLMPVRGVPAIPKPVVSAEPAASSRRDYRRW